MSVRYTARMQFGPHEDSDTIRDEILAVCREGQIDEVMFFAFAEEQNDGHDALERLGHWMAAIRPWKQALEAEGIEVSLNPWHTVLHCDRARTLKPDQPWQPMMDWRGGEASAVVCPLDPGWRAYYAEAMRLFAAERFRVVWVDDDIRYRNHEPLDWGGCWCPLHIAEFNKRAGESASREEVVRALTQPGEPHPWRRIWLDMWDELHCELVASWRDIVEAEGCALGLMSSGLEAHAVEGRRWHRWWEALAGEKQNVHRPHFWGYSDGLQDALVYGIAQMQQNRSVQPDSVESVPEIECFPYGPWNKSFRQTMAQMMLAQVFGSDRLAVSLYDFMGNLPSDEPGRAEFLARVKPALDWIGEQFPKSMTSVGVGVPWHEDMSRRTHTNRADDWWGLTVETQGWDRWLGPLGFAFAKSVQPEVNALAGAMPWAFDDEEIRGFLAGGLLLDGPAAAALVERGLGAHIGLGGARFITQEDVLYSTEESVDGEFGLRPRAQMSLNAEKPYKNRLLQGELLESARMISALRSPVQERVGHGAFVFDNSLGGRVAVMPWDATAGTNLCTQRRAQLDKVIAWLARGVSTGAVDGGAWLVPQFMSDGDTWRGVVWNGSPDARCAFEVRPPKGMPAIQQAVLCAADGRRVEGSVAGGRVTLPEPMHQWECVILL